MAQQAAASAAASPAKRPSATDPASKRAEKKRKLTFNEGKELAALPERIDAAERERAQLYASLGDPAVFRDPEALGSAKARVAALDVEIAGMVERWEALETIAADG
jgi:ABC transport system ATP-binding/permease protein